MTALALQRLRRMRRPRRGLLEIGLVLVVCLLAGAAVFGSGLAQTVLNTPDPLVWLRNLRGELIRVNPDTGTPVQRLPVAAPNDPLTVVQGDGVLVVKNLRTNEVVTIDLSRERVSGVRPNGESDVKVLLTMGEVYLVDKTDRRVDRIDALSAATVGTPWRSPDGLADVVADEHGSVWALSDRGHVTGLRWSAGPATLVEREQRQLDGVGARAVLVSHVEGVTAMDPSGHGGQIGTGQDRTISVGALDSPLLPADRSPRELVPVATPQSLELIRDNGVVGVNTPALGCREVGRAAVYSGRVYAPCPRDRKVLVLGADGRRAGDDLAVPAGAEIELTPTAGLLVIHVPGAPNGLVVRPDGSTRQIRTDDPTLPAPDPAARPTTATIQGRSTSDKPKATPGPTRTTVMPTPSPTPSVRASELTPTGVTAQARPDGSILVSWTPAAVRPTSYRILRVDNNTSTPVGTAASDATTAIVTGVPPGQTTRFIVEAVAVSGSFPSQPSDPVAAYGRPGGPTISVQLVARGPASVTLRLGVGVVNDGGSPVTAYDVAVTADGNGRTLASAVGVPIGQNPYQATFSCATFFEVCVSGGLVHVSATLSNGAGAGPTMNQDTYLDPPPPWQYDGSVMIVTTGLKCLDWDLGIHTCDGSPGQFWSIRRTGDIRNPANRNQCLASNGGLHFATDSCTERAKRWDLYGSGNINRTIHNQDSGRCIYVNGDPAGEGFQFRDRGCTFNQQELFAFFTMTIPLTAAVANDPGGSGVPLGAPAIALLLLPLAAAVVWRIRRTGRHRR